MRTSFFKLNSIKRSDFYDKKLEKAIENAWKVGSYARKPVKEYRFPFLRFRSSPTCCEQLHVDDIDSFIKVRKVSPSQVKRIVPLNVEENFIKNSLAEIIGEQFIQKDWGGECGDLYTTRVILKGKRIATAFMLKGKGLRGKLTLSKCGKNGDQILRLLRLPARLFIVQHINVIDPSVTEFLEMAAERKSHQINKRIYYCLMDGVDTARVLLAYNKLSCYMSG